MAEASAAVASSVQPLLAVLWGVVWFAGIIVLYLRCVAAERRFYRQFDWIKENWVTRVETPPWNVRWMMFDLAFRPQPNDPELERCRRAALRRLLLLIVWAFGWGMVLVAGSVFFGAAG